MKTQTSSFTVIARAVALAAGLLMMAASVYATENAGERRDARDVKQDSRQDARKTKVDCRQDNQKSNSQCRQDKREDKQDGREDSRDVRSGGDGKSE